MGNVRTIVALCRKIRRIGWDKVKESAEQDGKKPEPACQDDVQALVCRFLSLRATRYKGVRSLVKYVIIAGKTCCCLCKDGGIAQEIRNVGYTIIVYS